MNQENRAKNQDNRQLPDRQLRIGELSIIYLNKIIRRLLNQKHIEKKFQFRIFHYQSMQAPHD